MHKTPYTMGKLQEIHIHLTVVISFPCKLDSPSSSIPLSVMLSNKVGFTFGPNPSFWALKPGDGYNIFTGFRA